MTDNIYKLYSDNIAPLTPMIADRLQLDEEEYGEEWITEAIRVAVMMNKKSMSYIEAILKNRKSGIRRCTDLHAAADSATRYAEWEKR